MKISNNFKAFFLFLFFVFMLENNLAMELGIAIFQRIKYKTPILSASSMQLSFDKYNNLLTLYLGQKLFRMAMIQNLITLITIEEGDSILKKQAKNIPSALFCFVNINNNFEDYFAQNLKNKKYINFSTNIL